MQNIPIRKINTPRKELHPDESFSIRKVAEVLGGTDMVQELHSHDFFYVLALEEGSGSHDIDFRSFGIRDHSVFFMRPGQVHRLDLKAGSTGYLMEFKADFYHATGKPANQLLRKASKANFCQLEAGGFEKLYAIMSYIFQEYTTRQERYGEVIRAQLDIFFIELLRQRKCQEVPEGDGTLYMRERLEDFLDLLETHIGSHKQVGYYAEALHLSLYQLSAITKSILGKTPSELVNEHIVLEAKRYLLSTSNQVNQVAYRLGYEDVSYFIRFFKKHTGYTPEAFRHNFG